MEANTQQPAGHGHKITVDDQLHVVNDPILTGRQILDLAARRPPEEHLVYFFEANGLLEDIGLEETVDLREPGVERFLTFKSDRSFRFELDSRRQDWGAPKITETTLRKLAGVGDDYAVWQERQKQEDLRLERGQLVDLSEPGVERFYTGRDDTNAGATSAILPQADQRYISEHELEVQDAIQGAQKGIIFKRYPLPLGLFDSESADVLVVLPSGYPDTAPDMFFVEPWLKLRQTNAYPEKADGAHEFAGRRWQRWSRHNDAWRRGVDGIQTMLRRIDRALRGAK